MKDAQKLVVVLTIVAFGLRIYWLDGQSMWSDEGLSLYRARLGLTEILINTIVVDGVVTQDVTPPLYFLLLAGWRWLTGETMYALRFLSASLGALATPLLFVLGRWLFSARVGVIAALLMAVSPFHVFYSQELRNYTLLITLNLLSVALVWRLLHAPRRERIKLGGAWLAVAAAMVYTHYFALFVLAFELLALLVVTLSGRVGRRAYLLLGLVALVAAPLLPYGLSRLRAGPQFDYYPLSILTILHQTITAYSLGMVREVARPWTEWWPFLTLALVGLGVGWWARRRPAIVFTLGYLILPLTLLLAISQITPIYNGPRHILLGLPPFLLLIAVALGSGRGWVSLLGAPILAFVIYTQAGRLYQQFFAPEMIKDDVRGAAQYLMARAEPQDIIVLHDALIRFTFDYYYTGPASVTTIPRFATGNVEASRQAFERLAATHPRLWFVSLPGPRDGFPRDALPTWLDQRFFQASQAPFHALWLPVEVEEYRVQPPILDTLPGQATALNRRWAGDLELLGYVWRAGIPRLGEPVKLTLFWRATQPITSNARINVKLVDQSGQSWWTAENGFYDELPPTRWPVGKVIAQDYQFDLPAGLTPTRYTFRLQLKTDQAGILKPRGTETEPGWVDGPALQFERRATPPDLPAAIGRQPLDAQVGGLDLVAYDSPLSGPRPGERWNGSLFWRVRQALAQDVRVHTELVNAQGQIVAEADVVPAPPDFPTSAWRPGDLAQTRLSFVIPSSLPGGAYRLRVSLLDPTDQPLPARQGWRPWPSDTVDLGRVQVRDWPLETKVPPVQVPVDAEIGAARLRGVNIAGAARPGNTLKLTLVWQATARFDASYKVFVHLVDEQGKIRAQADGLPVGGKRPTDGWRPNEVLLDERALDLPADLPPGAYRLNVGLYRVDTEARAPATLYGQRLPNDQVDLGPLVKLE